MFGFGFFISSTLSFVLLAWIGERMLEQADAQLSAVLFGVVCTLVIVVDLRNSRRGIYRSLGPTRQTPQLLGRMPAGPLLWGLDTGVPLTTVRSTVLPVVAIAAMLFGYGAWWFGALYAMGFVAALCLVCELRVSTWDRSEPLGAMRTMSQQLPRLRSVGVAIAMVVVAIAVGEG